MIRQKTPRVTQKDIAHHLSVSQSLVAAVLSNRAGVWVSEENRLRIQRAAQDMHYRPNAAAQSLRNGRSNTVGMVVVSGEDGYKSGECGLITAALVGFSSTHGFDLKFRFFSVGEPILEQLSELVDAGWSDVLVLTGPEALLEAQGVLLEQMRMPFIVIGDLSERYPGWYQVDFDQEAMMALSVAHLAAQGHRRLAFIGHLTTEGYSRRLEVGFSKAVKESFGTAPDETLMGRVLVDTPGETSATATHFLTQWLSRPPDEQPTALVFGASDDGSWREAELALLQFGRRFGNQPGEIGTAGVHYTTAPLLFGQASAFLQTDMGRLTDTMCEHLLAPLMEGRQPESRFLRVCPALQPLPTLDL
ncbi:MAG: LacI family DNA-binding transcriptional regulator [Janthinobacterium lividum]